MNRNKFSGILVVLGLFVLSACATARAASPSAAAEAVVTEAVATPEPESGECLACHTEKQSLIDTAKPEEVVEKESSGAG